MIGEADSEESLFQKVLSLEAEKLRRLRDDGKLDRSSLNARIEKLQDELQQLANDSNISNPPIELLADNSVPQSYITVRPTKNRKSPTEWDSSDWNARLSMDEESLQHLTNEINEDKEFPSAPKDEVEFTSGSEVKETYYRNKKGKREHSLSLQYYPRFSAVSAPLHDKSKSTQQLLYTLPDAFDYNTDLSGGLGSKKRLSEIKSVMDKVKTAKPDDVPSQDQSLQETGSLVSAAAAAEVSQSSEFEELFRNGRSRKSTSASEYGELSPEPDAGRGATPVSDVEEQSTVFEFCIVEADWKHLSNSNYLDKGQQLQLTPLLPPRLLWRYPSAGEMVMDDLKQSRDQNFFFPSGVTVDLVPLAVADLHLRASNNKRHIVQFSDEVGQVTYACCLTTTHAYTLEEMLATDERIIFNLRCINNMKHAARCVQKSYRTYAENKKKQAWLRSSAHVSRTESFITVSSTSEPALHGHVKKGFFSKIFGGHKSKPSSVNGGSASSDLLSNTTTHGFPAVESAKASAPPAGHHRKPSAIPSLDQIKLSIAGTISHAKKKGPSGGVGGAGGFNLLSMSRDRDNLFTAVNGDLQGTLKTDSSQSDSPSRASMLAKALEDYTSKQVDATNVNETLKSKVCEEILLDHLSTEERHELVSIIIDLIGSNPNELNSTLVPTQVNDTSQPDSNNKEQTLKKAIENDLIHHSWPKNDLEDILQLLLHQLEDEEVAQPAHTELGRSSEKEDECVESVYNIDYGGSLDEDPQRDKAAEEEADLKEWVRANMYRYVVTTQRAFCIVSSIPEYTYIFKVIVSSFYFLSFT